MSDCEDGEGGVLPAHFEWFRDQIAGHHPSVVKNGEPQIGFIKERGSDLILKLAQEGRRGRSEVGLYEGLRKGDGHPALARLLPRFHGLRRLPIGTQEDITSPFKQPAIMDIKVGRVTFDPEASAAKRASEMKKYLPQETLGFRLLGYRIHTADGGVRVRDKDWGRSRHEGNVQEAIEEFLSARGPDSRVTTELLRRLEAVRSWAEEQREIHLFASSLLIVYEAVEEREPSLDMRLIDFSHVFPAEGHRDSNYIHGIERLVHFVSQIHSSFRAS